MQYSFTLHTERIRNRNQQWHLIGRYYHTNSLLQLIFQQFNYELFYKCTVQTMSRYLISLFFLSNQFHETEIIQNLVFQLLNQHVQGFHLLNLQQKLYTTNLTTFYARLMSIIDDVELLGWMFDTTFLVIYFS